MISIESKGSFNRMNAFLRKLSEDDMYSRVEKFAKEGVRALASATPIDSGETKTSWNYEITHSKGSWSIAWTNTHSDGGTPVAILLQYGHGTGTGGYVQGRDYINPAMKPIFDKIADDVWKAVTSA